MSASTDGSSVAPYPAHWEADVVLADGGTAHVRPIVPDDAPLLENFHSRLSERTIYYRFFSAKRKLSEQEVQRFTVVDYDSRVALVALIGGQLIGVARYDRLTKEASNSPLVRTIGQRDQFTVGVGANYSFQIGN